MVLEADICGGGASGRNGGFALSWWAKLPSLVKLAGESGALQVCRESSDAVTELGEFASANGIDCDYRAGGWLWTARTDAQLGAWEGTVELAERLGADAFERLSPDEISRRAGSPQHLAGVLERTAATVQPAALVRGLRRVALEQGVRIHEHTVVRRIDRGGMRVETGGGSVEAGKIVIATNAWARQHPRAAPAAGRRLQRHRGHRADPRPARRDRLDRRRVHHRLPADDRLLPHHPRRADRLRQGRLADRLRRPHPRRIRRGRAARGAGRARPAAGLPPAGRRPGHAQLVGPDRPLADRPAAARAPWRPPGHRVRRRLERQRRRAVADRRPDPGVAGARPRRQLGAATRWSTSASRRSRRSRSGSSAPTSSARACTARSGRRLRAAGPAGSPWRSPGWPLPGSRTSSAACRRSPAGASCRKTSRPSAAAGGRPPAASSPSP